ncbi:MAG: hypothetical protein KGZ58_03745 [Ignavibacteriales bacterium]|nr:hypothetical protein [Ignavibacteriales bacterium]
MKEPLHNTVVACLNASDSTQPLFPTEIGSRRSTFPMIRKRRILRRYESQVPY